MTEEKIISIVIADDHPVFRNGLISTLKEEKQFYLAGEAYDGESALSRTIELEPDILLLDFNMPKMNGLQILRSLNEKHLSTKIIILTAHTDEKIFEAAMDNNVSGYIIKDSAEKDIKECILSVFEGNNYISPSMSKYLLRKREEKKKFEKEKPNINRLTETELKILRLISEGKTTREIAEILFISFKTAENHRINISSKLELKGTHSLVKFAFENKSSI